MLSVRQGRAGMPRLLLALACAPTLAGSACVGSLPAFDCDRAGALCEDGAVCVSGRCAEAVPTSVCASGLRYAPSAGALAGRCVEFAATVDGAPPDALASGPDAPAPVPDAPPARDFETGQAAEIFLGQPDPISNLADAFGPGLQSLDGPGGLVFAPGEGLYVTDSMNHRVLVFEAFANGTAATYVIGQPDTTSDTPSTELGRLDTPLGLDLDGSGWLYVVEQNNNRVSAFSAAPSFTFAETFGGPGPTSPSTMSYPADIAILDDAGTFVVADGGDHRLTFWSPPFVNPPFALFGQADSISSLPNRGGPAGPDTVNNPVGVLWDGDSLWVADSLNHRVLRVTDLTADLVYGQPDFATVEEPPTSPESVLFPVRMCQSPTHFAISDYLNHRVLVFHGRPSQTNLPYAVLGQADFSTNEASGGPTGLQYPIGCAFGDGFLFVADMANNRVVGYRGE